MIKNLILAATLLFGGLTLGACNLTGSDVAPGGVPSVSSSQVSSAITTVQQATVRACGFLPAVQTVTAILSTFVASAQPIVMIGNEIANGICSAVVPKKASSLRKLGAPEVIGPPTYHGVPISGGFVR